MEALAAYHRSQCGGCGWSALQVNDPRATIHVDHATCPVCAEQSRYDRVLADGEPEKQPPAKAMRPSDGRRVVSSIKWDSTSDN